MVRSGPRVDPLIAEHRDFLPDYQLMPRLTPEEVERYVGLGEQGWERFRAGDATGAERSFRGQIAIFPANPEPFVSLALLESNRGAKKAAVAFLHAAVVRGFADLGRVDRAEVWTPMRGNLEYQKLQDALPAIIDIDSRWPDWSSFWMRRAPEDVETVLSHHARDEARIDSMAPALGPRLTTLWKRLLARLAAARLEVYVTKKPQAPDLHAALGHLMTLCAGGPLLRWERLPAELTRRLATVADLVLEHFPESSMRPNALVALALARNSERDKRGRLSAGAADEIRTNLDEVLTRFADSAVAATAAVGLIRTEVGMGRADRAAARYGLLREGRTENPAVFEWVREELGELALRLGGLPEFRAKTLDGKAVGPESLRGKVAVIDFWATWCRPCVDGFPALRRVAARHGGEVVLLGVNLDSAEDFAAEELGEWVAREGVPGDHVYDGLGWDSELVRSFGVGEIPFNLIVGPDGAVLDVNAHGKRLEKAVSAAVRANGR